MFILFTTYCNGDHLPVECGGTLGAQGVCPWEEEYACPLLHTQMVYPANISQLTINYLFHGFEVKVTEFVDVLGLITKDLSREVVENVGETLRDRVLLDVLACHL
jgi:hypothetical protein